MHIISEEQYEPSLQGITFSLEHDAERLRFIISKKALADYFEAEHSTEAVLGKPGSDW